MSKNPLSSPFFIGNLQLRSNIFCSPLAGCSDLPFRQMLTKYKPGLFFCEMVKMDALVRHDPVTYRILDYDGKMHPTAAQLVGSRKDLAGPAAKIIEDLGFDLVDLNCGCPVDKVTKDGSGSGLLRSPDLIGDLVSNMVAAVKIPVTIKVRTGWDESSINVEEIVKIAEQAGAKVISVHGRTRAQGYRGPAVWKHIAAAKRAATTIKVFGNGDLFSAQSAVDMYEQTNCDGFLVSRGSFGQPWIFEDIERKFLGLPPINRTGKDIYKALVEHMEAIVAYRHEKRAVMDMRRVACWFLKPAKGAKKLRESLSQSKQIAQMRDLINNYNWDEVSLAEFDASSFSE